MVNVGINENVIISNAELLTDNDKASLAITFREKDAPKIEGDIFDQLSGEGEVATGNSKDGTTIRMWPPLKPLPDTKDGQTKSASEMAKEAADALGERKNALLQILSVFMTSDKIKFNMFAGMETLITREKFESNIVKEEVIKSAFINMANQFLAMIAPHLDKEDSPVRLLLVRQSKTKHYAAFRERYVKDNPFIESAHIPKDASKLKWTAYEIKEKLNDPTPVAQAAADATTEQAPVDVANIFGEGGAVPENK